MPIPNPVPPVPQQSAKTHALALLQRWIIDGTLADGERIADAALAQALGISRTPVREALLILETQGFVEMRRGRDTRIRPLQPQAIYELYPPLAALERTAALLALPRVTPDLLERLRTTNAAFARALANHDVFAAMEEDETFHNLLVQCADNPYVTSFITTLQLHVRRLKFRFFSQTLPGQTSVQEHADIIRALETQDADRLASTMEQNWLRPMRELGGTLSESNAQGSGPHRQG